MDGIMISLASEGRHSQIPPTLSTDIEAETLTSQALWQEMYWISIAFMAFLFGTCIIGVSYSWQYI